jgi:TRAP-type C4-dicarboxylate transport system permease small subunit
LSRLSDAVTAIFCFFLAYQGWVYVSVSFEMGDREVILGIPMWLIQAVIPYALVSMGVRHVLFTIDPTLRPKQINEGAN